jgi:ABC-type branched-subunit amino acid transport system substrate-binding protein
VGFIQDDQVFMVVGTTSFGIGVQCVTAEFKTPLLMIEWLTDEVYAQGAPYAFNIPTSISRIFRDYPRWAANRGIFAGKKIGLYYWNDPDLVAQINKYLKPQFASLGIEKQVVVDMQTDSMYGGPNDNVAVQRFRTAGVDVAIIIGVLRTNFTQAAQAQGYKPQYIDADYGYGGDDTTQSNNEPNNYDGALATAGWRWGERGSNLPRDDLQMKCKNDYKAYSGIDNGRDDYQTAAEAVLWQSCDVARLLMTGLQAAGPTLTADSMVKGLETIKNQRMAYFGNVTFAPGKHHGVDQQRTIQYNGGCKCWKVVTDFAPLPVP